VLAQARASVSGIHNHCKSNGEPTRPFAMAAMLQPHGVARSAISATAVRANQFPRAVSLRPQGRARHRACTTVAMLSCVKRTGA
jgi:hypothetical protein